MGHDHSTAAISFQAQFIHSISAIQVRLVHRSRSCCVTSPVRLPGIGYELEVALPQVPRNLLGSARAFLRIAIHESTFPQEKHRIGMIILSAWLRDSYEASSRKILAFGRWSVSVGWMPRRGLPAASRLSYRGKKKFNAGQAF